MNKNRYEKITEIKTLLNSKVKRTKPLIWFIINGKIKLRVNNKLQEIDKEVFKQEYTKEDAVISVNKIDYKSYPLLKNKASIQVNNIKTAFQVEEMAIDISKVSDNDLIDLENKFKSGLIKEIG